MPAYSTLQAASIRATIARLARRIEERFPGSGLSGVARELERLGEENEAVVERLRKPLWGLRVVIGVALALLVGITAWAAFQIARTTTDGLRAADLLASIEAATSELVFLSLAAFFFASLETRMKRRDALRTLHRLRSLAHVVDMHQLSKNPEHVLHRVEPTPSSPTRTLTRDQLARYLDYCSELLSLTSKLAALHAQHLQDPVVLGAVNEIESLTAALSGKVWQKITILDIAEPESITLLGPSG